MKFTLFSILLLLVSHISMVANPQEFSSRSQLEEEFPCIKLYGAALQDCMKVLDNEKYKKTLILLDREEHDMEQFLKDLLQNPEDYEVFFDRFTQEEWVLFYNSLASNAQKLIPNIYSKEDQIEFVKKKKFNRNLKYSAIAVSFGAAALLALKQRN